MAGNPFTAPSFRSLRTTLDALAPITFALVVVLSGVVGPVGAAIPSTSTASGGDTSSVDATADIGSTKPSVTAAVPDMDAAPTNRADRPARPAAFDPIVAATSWSTAGGDPARTGHDANASGPKTDANARWIAEHTDQASRVPTVVADGLAFLPGRNTLRAVDNETGEEVWSVTTPDYDSLTVADGVVVTTDGGYGGEIRAYDVTDGSTRWSEPDFETEASVLHDGTLYAVRSTFSGPYLYAFDLATGSKQQVGEMHVESLSGGLSAAGDTIYATATVSDRDSAVVAFDATDAGERWRFEMEGPARMHPVVVDGSVYVGAGSESFDPTFYRLNVTDGHVEWAFDINAQPTGAAVAGGHVYVVSDNTLRALDLQTGERRWLHRLGGSLDYGLQYTSIDALPPVVADGVVYAVTDRGHLVALDTGTGAELWAYRLAGEATRPAVAGERVYVQALDLSDHDIDRSRLYALEEPPFAVSGFSVETTSVAPGEAFAASVTVENVDDEARRYELSLVADSPLPVGNRTLDRLNGTLNPGESATLTYSARVNISGAWNVSVRRHLEAESAVAPLTVSVVHPSRVDVWSQTDFDGGRSKYNPDTVGPKQHLQEVWNLTSFQRSLEPTIADGTVVVVQRRSGYNGDPTVYTLAAYAETTGSQQWEFNVSARDRIPAGSPSVDDGTVYLFAHPYNFDGDGPKVVDGSVFALNLTDGSLEWRRDLTLNASVSSDQAPVVADGQVYVAGGTREDQYRTNASLVALDADTGAVDWDYTVAEAGESELFHWVTASNGTVVASLSDQDYVDGNYESDDRLVVLDASGAYRWTPTGVAIDLSDPPVVRNGTIYVVNESRNDAGDSAETLVALNEADGSVAWEFVPLDQHDVADDWRVYAPVVTDDAVYLRQMMLDTSPYTKELYRVDPATGTLVWNRSVPSLLDFAVVDGLIYAGDANGGYNDGDETFLYDAETGEYYGETDLLSRGHGSVKAVANGTMVVYTDSTTPNDFRVLREGGVVEYTDLAVDRHVVGEGENVTVTATVTNVGTYARDYDVDIRVSPDDTYDYHVWNYPNREGVLEPGESTTVTWTVRLSRRGDFVFTLMPSHNPDSMNRYMYDRAGSVTVNVGDAADGQPVDFGGPRDLAPDASSWPKAGNDAGNTGNASGTGAPTAVGDVVRWSVNHSSEWTSGPTVAADTVYVGGSDDSGVESVFAYDATDGTLRWQASTVGSSDVEVAPTYASGYLYAADDDGRVYQFDAATGDRVWTYDVGRSVGGISVVDDVAYVTGSGYDSDYYGAVVALNATTREVLWTFQRHSSSYGMNVDPAVVDGTVYVTSDDGYTYALDATTGAVVWSRAIAGAGSRLHSPVVADGVVYVDDAAYGSTDGKVYALDASDGSTRWSTPANVAGYTGASPALANDTLYLVADGAVRALDANDGSTRWSTQTCLDAQHSPVHAGGVVYVPLTDSTIRAYDAETGALIWRYGAYDEESFAPAVADGVLFATGLENEDYTHSLVALDGGTTATSTPVFEYSGLSVSSSNVSTGESFTVSATVENLGDADCTYSADLVVDGAVVDTTTGSVSPGSYNTEAVTFTHSFASTGTYEVSVEDLPPVQVTVTEPSADPVLSPTTLDFGTLDVGNTTDAWVKITNDGTATLYPTEARITGANASAFTVLNQPQSVIYAGDSDYVWLRFAPGTPGSKTATLELDTIWEGTVTATLTGVAEGPPEVDVSPTSHDFGDVAVGSNATTTVTVKNVGGSALTFDGVQLTGPDAAAYRVVSGGGATTIAAGDSHTVTVEFEPTLTGTASAALELATDDADESTVSVSLTGTGTYTAPNTAPVAGDDRFTVYEGETLSVSGPGVLANDGDANGDSFDATHFSDPSHGTLSFAADGSFTYTPDPGFTGTDAFSYRIQDEHGAYSGFATVTVEVVPDPNRTPTAVAENYTVVAGETLSVAGPGVLANDYDPDGDAFDATHYGDPSHGTLSFASDGSFTYTPDPGFTGTDSFTYRIRDEQGAYSTFETVYVEVLPDPNREPTVVADAFAVARNGTLTVARPGVLANDYDLDGDAFDATHYGSPAHGTLSFASDGSFTYTPDPGFTGTDSFFYRTRDAVGDYSTFETVTVEVFDPAAEEPVAVTDGYTVTAGETLSVSGPGVLANDHDPDGDSFDATHYGDPSHGTLSFASDGSFTYTPDAGFTGTDAFTYRIRDADGDYSTFTTVRIEVLAENRGPEAFADHYTVTEGETLSVTGPGVLANDGDADGDGFDATHYGSPAHGTLSFASDGSFIYTPDPGFAGTDAFNYRIQDEHGAYSTFEAVTVEVRPDPNRAPTAVADAFTVVQGTTLTVSGPGVLANDYDADGDAFDATHYGDPSNGTLSFASDGSLTYTPDPGFTGTDSFSYRIRDKEGAYSTFAPVTFVVVDASADRRGDVSVTPGDVDFGTVPTGDTATAAVTVANVGDEDLAVSGASIAGPNASAFTVVAGDSATVLGYGETHTVTVAYDPSRVGVHDATLTVTSNDTDESSVDVALSGVGYDDAPPTVDAVAVGGSGRDGTTVYANDTVEVAVSVTDSAGRTADVEVTLDSRRTTYRVTADATYDAASGNWTATFATTGLVDDGGYDVVVRATDDSGNRADHVAAGRLLLDRTPPRLAATLTREDATTATVTVEASEALRPGSLTVGLERPDGTAVPVTMTDEGGHWNGTVTLPTDGQYDVTAVGVDLAGNRGTDRATSVLTTASSDANGTITVQIQPSGTFVRFTTTQPVTDTYVTMTESDTPLEPLYRDQTGVRFLNAELGDQLSATLGHALLGLPVDETTLPPGTDAEDVTIGYYNETSGQWEDVPTTVRNVTVDGTTGRYWVANVSHFSTYGTVVTDGVAPRVTSTSPTDGDELAAGTAATTLHVEYADAVSGVDPGLVTVVYDGRIVNGEAATTITSESVTYEASGLTDGSTHALALTIEDRAGNVRTETVTFAVASADADEPSPPSDDADEGRTPPAIDDDPAEQTPTIVADRVGDETLVVSLDGANAGEPLSTAVADGALGGTGVAIDRVTVTADVGGSHDLRVTAGDTADPALAPEHGTAIAAFTVSGSDGSVTTFQFTVPRARLSERGADPADVVGYRLVDGVWIAIELRETASTADAVGYEATVESPDELVLAIQREATATPTPSTTATRSSTDTATTTPVATTDGATLTDAGTPTSTVRASTTSTDTPGFGAVLALTALLLVGLLGRRRNSRE